MNSAILLSLWLSISASTAAAMGEVHHFKPAKEYLTYAVREPVLRINPGDTVVTNTLYSDFFTEKDGPWPGEVGPIYVSGATSEDTLSVRILKIRPNIATGRSGTSSTYGLLTATEMTPMLHEPVAKKVHVWRIDAKRMTAAHRCLPDRPRGNGQMAGDAVRVRPLGSARGLLSSR